jgi:hypothetical protein
VQSERVCNLRWYIFGSDFGWVKSGVFRKVRNFGVCDSIIIQIQNYENSSQLRKLYVKVVQTGVGFRTSKAISCTDVTEGFVHRLLRDLYISFYCNLYVI